MSEVSEWKSEFNGYSTCNLPNGVALIYNVDNDFFTMIVPRGLNIVRQDIAPQSIQISISK